MQTKTIKSKKESSELVREFFNDHAPAYRSKYNAGDSFYRYFFYQRLDKATEGIDFSNKLILDIGAGTGPLYDYLIDHDLNTFKKYDATDISDGMLSQSNIPKVNQFVGDFTNLQLNEKYDLIFMLGVSTYLSRTKMIEHMSKVSSLLKDDGMFIITFTHRKSLDIMMRQLLSPIVRLFSGKDKIINQDFETVYYSTSEIKALATSDFNEPQIFGLNHTVFPLSRILKRPSVKLAQRVSKYSEGAFKRWLSSDLLIKLVKK